MKNSLFSTVVLATTSHYINDDMLYFRYARTLSSLVNRVIVIGINNDCIVDTNIQFVRLPQYKARIKRFFYNAYLIKKNILKLSSNNTCVFLFTPDLLPLGFKLEKKGYQVVQLFVENYPHKILEKYWIPLLLRPLVSWAIKLAQMKLGSKCHANIFVDSYTMGMFKGNCNNCVLIPNYPICLDDINELPCRSYLKPLQIVYAGGLSAGRGFNFMMRLGQAFQNEVVLHIYGKAHTVNEQNEYLTRMQSLSNVVYHGFMPYDEILRELHRYDIGIAVYKAGKTFDYICENTTKIFEYMEFGLPIIASNAPGLKKIVVSEDVVGICIDISKEEECLQKLKDFFDCKEGLKKMASSGREKFLLHRNWKALESKLINIVSE